MGDCAVLAAMSLMQVVPEPLLREVLQQLVRRGDFAAIAAASCTCRGMAQLAAEEELGALDRNKVAQLKTYKVPPTAVHAVLQAVLLL